MASTEQEDLSHLQLTCGDGHKTLIQEEEEEEEDDDADDDEEEEEEEEDDDGDGDDAAAGPTAEPSQHIVESQTLFLSRVKMTEIKESVLRHTTLKNLYLEGNQILNLPDSMFACLPHLEWLDLRNNLIGSLPAEIGSHRCLKTLVLEGNPISELPPELGNILTLKGLNLRDCPIRCPPQDIIHQGLEHILQYLRSVMAERPLSVQRSHPDDPPVEKLRLSDLVKSSMESCGDEEEEEEELELQRFRELKHKMILLERAELCHGSSRTTRKKDAAISPHSQFDIQHWRSQKALAMEELKEKQDNLEQRKKDREFLLKWRTKAKVMQEQKAMRLEQEKREKQFREALEKKPCNVSADHSTKWQQGSKEQDQARAARDNELEQRIRKHMQVMQDRRRRPKGTVKEEKATAEQDMRESLKLQAELLERKQDKREKEYRFTAFTGDILSSWPDN